MSNSAVNYLNMILDMKKCVKNIKVVIYLRRQDLLLESKWNHHVKAYGEHRDIIDFYNANKDIFDFKKRIDEIARIVGEDNIVVRIYEKANFAKRKKGIFEDFVEACNINLGMDKFIYPKNSNERLDADFFWMKYLFNKYFKECNGKSYNNAVNKSFIEHNIKGVKQTGYLSEQQRKEIMKQYEEGNAYIAENYLNRQEGILFEENDYSLEEYKCDFTEREKTLIKMFADIVAKYEETT